MSSFPAAVVTFGARLDQGAQTCRVTLDLLDTALASIDRGQDRRNQQGMANNAGRRAVGKYQDRSE